MPERYRPPERMRRVFTFDTHAEAVAFNEGLMEGDNDAGTVERVEFDQRDDGKWLVTVHRKDDPSLS